MLLASLLSMTCSYTIQDHLPRGGTTHRPFHINHHSRKCPTTGHGGTSIFSPTFRMQRLVDLWIPSQPGLHWEFQSSQGYIERSQTNKQKMLSQSCLQANLMETTLNWHPPFLDDPSLCQTDKNNPQTQEPTEKWPDKTVVLKGLWVWGCWRDGSPVQSTGCSYRGLCLVLSTHMVTHNHLWLQFKVIWDLPAPAHTWCTDVHLGTHIHKNVGRKVGQGDSLYMMHIHTLGHTYT